MEGRGEGEAVWQVGGAHAGSRCLRVRLATTGDYYMAAQALSQPVAAGAMYQVRGWYRSDTEGVARPVVYFHEAGGRVQAAWETPLPAAARWTPFRFAFRPPVGTMAFTVHLRAQGIAGTAWFDDVFLGPARALEAAMRSRQREVRRALDQGSLALRALAPSDRPTLDSLGEAGALARVRRRTIVSLDAARGERESAGVLVLGLGAGRLTAAMSDLVGPRGARLASHRATVRWAGAVTARGSVVLDPLFNKQPFVAGVAAPPVLWVTVAVPREGCPAGAYRGTLTARSGGRTAALPVALRVRDFALPKTPSLPTSFWLFRHTIRNWYGLKEVPFDVYRRYLDLCLDARIAPIDAAEWHDQPFLRIVRRQDGELAVDWSPWDRYLSYCFARGMSAFNVADDHWFGNYFASFDVHDPATGRLKRVTLDPKGDEYARRVTWFFREARAHFGAKGWAERAYLQAYDEPGRDAALLAEIARFHRLAREGWPGLRTLITAPPGGYEGLHGSTGIWCPLTPHYDEAAAGRRRALGEEVWWYVCVGPGKPWANFFLTQPGAGHRVLLWQTFSRGAQGLLYWGVNHWPGAEGRTMAPTPTGTRWPAAPWNDGGRDGDGYFIYPGPDGPLGSTRLEILRDGMEDYDALVMLRDLARRAGRPGAPTKAEVDAALSFSPSLYRSMTNYPDDASALAARRVRVNALIERLVRAR
jgi:hypothetical protein